MSDTLIDRIKTQKLAMPISPTAKKTVANVASDGFRWNCSRRVHARITKFHTVVEDNWPHKAALYDVASCFRAAENPTKYWTKEVRKMGPADHRVKLIGHCLTQIRQMLYGHPCRPIAYSRTGYEVTSYLRSALI